MERLCREKLGSMICISCHCVFMLHCAAFTSTSGGIALRASWIIVFHFDFERYCARKSYLVGQVHLKMLHIHARCVLGMSRRESFTVWFPFRLNWAWASAKMKIWHRILTAVKNKIKGLLWLWFEFLWGALSDHGKILWIASNLTKL